MKELLDKNKILKPHLEPEEEEEEQEDELISKDPGTIEPYDPNFEGKFKEMINIKDASSGIELNCASASLDFAALSLHVMNMRDYMMNTNLSRFKNDFRRYIG